MGKKILLADDSITIQKVIELTFSDEDFDVVTVGNGRLAVEKAQEIRPDVVLCDIIMPERDGYEVCDFIKKHPALNHVPVLLLTGAFEPFDQERAARVGADGFLSKPFEPQALIAKVKDLLAQAQSRPAAGPRRVPEPAATTPRPSPVPAVRPVEPEPLPEPTVTYLPEEPLPGRPAAGAMDFAPETLAVPPTAAPQPAGGGYDSPAADALLGLAVDDDTTLHDMPAPSPETTVIFTAGTLPSPPQPWVEQPTLEVSLEDRAQAGLAHQAEEPPVFEEVFEEETLLSATLGQSAPEPEAAVLEMPAVEPEPVVEAQTAAPAPVAPLVPAVRVAPVVPEPAVAATTAPPAREDSFADLEPAVAEAEPAPAPASATAAVSVPVDMVETIAQRVVGQISEKVIREIAWEVVPELAEALIKREIERLKADLPQG